LGLRRLLRPVSISRRLDPLRAALPDLLPAGGRGAGCTGPRPGSPPHPDAGGSGRRPGPGRGDGRNRSRRCGDPLVAGASRGGVFGGYMANWVAGHTDRFRAIVTHASLWALDQFHGTTDEGHWWECEFGNPYEDPRRYEENSPHRHIARITTPVLVIHGELDH